MLNVSVQQFAYIICKSVHLYTAANFMKIYFTESWSEILKDI